jgi:tetratricopeptide (TPR) repeat protein
MFYWTVLIISAVALGAMFLRRLNLTRKGLAFEEQLKKDEDRQNKDYDDAFTKVEEESPSDLQLKRAAEQKSREEKSRRLREGKKAFKQAEMHFSKGDYGLAEKHLLNVLSFDNDHLNANLKLGLLYLHQENLPRAEFFFQKLLDLKESPIYYSNLALTLYQQSRLEESAKLYERAIELDNKKPGRFVSLAHVYHELGEMDKALEHFEVASRLDPRNLDYLWNLLEYYEKFTRHQDMERIVKRILELDPYNDQAKGKLALLIEEMGDEPIPVEEEKSD